MLIIGNHVSPYAHKVIVAMALKGLEHEMDPIIPFFGDDEFTKISPLRRIPVLVDDGLILCDSSVICEYLDEAYPDPPLMPKDPAERARARWIEEFCDTRLGDVMIWKLFFQKVIGPGVWRQPTDETIVAEAVETDLPAVMDWFEAQAPEGGFLFGQVGMADIAPACFFRNAELAGWTPDASRWPRTAGWIARVQAIPAFSDTIPFEQIMLTNRPTDQRSALAAAGLRVSTHSYGTSSPRKGVMPI